MVRRTPLGEVLLALAVWVGVLGALSLRASGQEAGPPPDPQEQAAGKPAAQGADPADAERDAVWNSPAMLSARAWLNEYFRTSKQASPEAERAYLERLSQLSADQMREWLGEMSAKRSRVLQEQGRTANLRQWSYGQVRQSQVSAQQAARTQPSSRGSQLQNAGPPGGGRGPQQAGGAGLASQQAGGVQRLYQPLPSVRMLFFLDAIELRNDLRELQQSRGR